MFLLSFYSPYLSSEFFSNIFHLHHIYSIQLRSLYTCTVAMNLVYFLMQILMSVQLILMTVIRSVLTLMGPTLVPVTVDIHWIAMEEHAMVC